MTEKDTNTDSDGNGREKQDKIKLKAHDLEVSAQFSANEDFDDVMDRCSAEMKEIMRESMRGEMAVIEEENLFGAIIGGD